VQVEFRYIVFDLFVNAACTGDTVLGRTSAGVYSDTFRTAGGCDSIRILHLSYRANPVSTTISVALCEGQQYAGYSRTGRYVDVFKAVNGCDSTRTLNLVVNPVYRQTREVQICDGSSYRAGGTLQTRSGIYYDTLRTRQGCDSVIVTQLSVTPLPVQFLPQDTTLCLGRTMSISLPQFRSTLWNSGSIDYNLLISAPGKYWVNVVDVNNCRGVDTIEVRYQRCIPIQVPNAFSPNGDYMNDVFRPVIPVVLKNYRMQIYSRLGFVIFETTDYRRGWDGKVNGILQNQGVYVYLIRFTDDDGKEVVKNGTLLLVR
jgi:gliding motility-associated-like protein